MNYSIHRSGIGVNPPISKNTQLDYQSKRNRKMEIALAMIKLKSGITPNKRALPPSGQALTLLSNLTRCNIAIIVENSKEEKENETIASFLTLCYQHSSN